MELKKVWRMINSDHWVGGLGWGEAQRGCHMWKGYRLILSANVKDEATVIKAYKIMRGTESMFTDINVRELPVLEKYVYSLPQQMQKKCLLFRQAAVCSYQQFPSKPGSVSTESPPSERNKDSGGQDSALALYQFFSLQHSPSPITFPHCPSKEGSLPLFSLAARSLRSLNRTLHPLYSPSHWYGYCPDTFCLSDLWLTTTQTPSLSLLTFLQVTLAFAGEWFRFVRENSLDLEAVTLFKTTQTSKQKQHEAFLNAIVKLPCKW